MGMRQNIALHFKDKEYGHSSKIPQVIYIYSHWDGEEGMSPLKLKLKKALGKKWRWEDDSYLSRIIVSEVFKDDIDGETGYGIAPYPIDEDFPTIHVDLKNQTVDGISFEEFIK
jgi:hypothetical protein